MAMTKRQSMYLNRFKLFLNEKYDLSYDTFLERGLYAGGNLGCHLNYYKLRTPNRELPVLQNHCVCGHDIVENCYVDVDDIFVVMGNCCIKRFMPKETSGRTCEACKQPHRNRSNNLCNKCRASPFKDCRYNSCFVCGKIVPPAAHWPSLPHSYMCDDCQDIPTCLECGERKVEVTAESRRCYACH